MRSLDAVGARPDLRWLDREYGPGRPCTVFDFDGVLASPVEDLVYKLPERAGERGVLSAEAARYGINAEIYDTPYLRHLVLQSVLHASGELPGAGPLLPLAREMTRARHPFFILTARSGRAAVQRVFSFLDQHGLQPQEVFCVGRVPKGRQLALVAGAMPDERRVVYFEDTARHARNSHKQDGAAIATVHLVWDPLPWGEAEALVERTLRESCLERSVA